MSTDRRTWRRVLLLGVPFLYVLLGLVHPTANPELGDETDLFVRLHIAQLFLIVGLAWVLWFLVEDVDSRAATVARVLIIPFVVAYTALDSILGIAWGIAAETANDLPAVDQRGAGRLIDELISGDPDPEDSSSTSARACSGWPWRLRSWRRSGTPHRSVPSWPCRWGRRCSPSATPRRWDRSGWGCSWSASRGSSSALVRPGSQRVGSPAPSADDPTR